MPRSLAYALMVLTWFCWGFSYPATAIALASFDVWTSRTLVMLAAGLAMLAIAWLQGHDLRIPRGEWRDLTIAGVCNMAIFQIGMTYGVYLLSAGRTAVIVYTMPLWAALFAAVILNERLTRARLAALVLGLIGLAVLLAQDLTHLRNAPLGAISTLIAAVSFGLGTVWMKRRRWTANLTVLGGWQLMIGVVPVALVWAVIAPPWPGENLSTASLLAVLYLVLIANALAYFAWFRVVDHFPATVSGIGAMAVPVVGVAASALLTGETIGWRELCALALICSALAINLFRP